TRALFLKTHDVMDSHTGKTRTVTDLRVQLMWSAKMVKAVVTGTTPEFVSPISALEHIDDAAGPVSDGAVVGFQFGSFSAARPMTVTGTAKRTTVVRSGVSFDLHSVTLKGSA